MIDLSTPFTILAFVIVPLFVVYSLGFKLGEEESGGAQWALVLGLPAGMAMIGLLIAVATISGSRPGHSPDSGLISAGLALFGSLFAFLASAIGVLFGRVQANRPGSTDCSSLPISPNPDPLGHQSRTFPERPNGKGLSGEKLMRQRSPALSRVSALALLILMAIGLLPATTRAQAESTPAAPSATPIVTSGHDVPTLAGGPARTGEMPGPGPVAAPAVRWQVETGAFPLAPDAFFGALAEPFFLNQEPAVSDGTIFAPAAGGGLVALDSATGQERWRLPDGQEGDGSIASPTAIDGIVYVGRGDGAFFALDAQTGDEVWRLAVDAEDHVSTSVVLTGTTIFAGTINGTVLALDAATGAERWRMADPDEYRVGSLAATGDTIYALRSDGSLQALQTATGKERWRFETVGLLDDGFLNLFTAYPVLADGLVIFGGRSSVLYAVDAATGTERWRLRIGLDRLSAPAVVDGVVYVAAHGSYIGGFRTLYAIDAASGDVRWAVLTDGLHTPPVVADGVVYAGGAAQTAWAFDAATGAVLWSLDLDFGGEAADIAVANTAPVVVDGVVYVGTRRSVVGQDNDASLVSTLYAITGDAAPPTTGDGEASLDEASIVVPPGGCAFPPPDPADILAAFAEPRTATSSDATPAQESQADLEAIERSIGATASRFIACNNTNDLLRQLFLFSDGQVRAVLSGLELEPVDAPAFLAVLSNPHAPIPPEMWLEFVSLDNVELLPDGRVVASIVVRDPDGRQGTLGRWIFVRAGDRWLIDSFDGEDID